MGLVDPLALDVSLISATLSLFVASGEPLGALNNRFLVEAYAFVVINATLRFDWRLCAFASVLALGQFLGITTYVAHHWNLSSLTSRHFGSFEPLSHAFRVIVLAGVGASSVAAAKWARHLRLMVGTDHLTGLSQRRPFMERIEEELGRSGERTTLSVALFDVDEFKRYNDRFGHLAGDQALQLLAQRLRKLVRTTDLVARFGGEEFVVAFPRMEVGRATRRVNELRAELAQVRLPTGEGLQHLTVSAGVGSWPEDGSTFDEVLAHVDDRLYSAKRSGRDRVVGPPEVSDGSFESRRERDPSLHACPLSGLVVPCGLLSAGLSRPVGTGKGATWRASSRGWEPGWYHPRPTGSRLPCWWCSGRLWKQHADWVQLTRETATRIRFARRPRRPRWRGRFTCTSSSAVLLSAPFVAAVL